MSNQHPDQSRRLTLREINDLPEHGGNYIYEYSSNEVQLDGIFTKAQLRQLADFVPSEKGQ